MALLYHLKHRMVQLWVTQYTRLCLLSFYALSDFSLRSAWYHSFVFFMVILLLSVLSTADASNYRMTGVCLIQKVSVPEKGG